MWCSRGVRGSRAKRCHKGNKGIGCLGVGCWVWVLSVGCRVFGVGCLWCLWRLFQLLSYIAAMLMMLIRVLYVRQCDKEIWDSINERMSQSHGRFLVIGIKKENKENKQINKMKEKLLIVNSSIQKGMLALGRAGFLCIACINLPGSNSKEWFI